MGKRMTVDFRLVETLFELSALEKHLKLVEEQLKHSAQLDKQGLEEILEKYGLTPDDVDWHWETDEYSRNVGFVYPMVLRNSFLVSLYSTTESATTEIARLIQKKKAQKVALDNIRRGGFLDRAKKYYKQIPDFNLCENNQTWERLRILAGLRNAIVHANGRLEMANKKNRNQINKWIKLDMGIECRHGYILVSEQFVQDTSDEVQTYSKDLVQSYKDWDDKFKRQQNTSA